MPQPHLIAKHTDIDGSCLKQKSGWRTNSYRLPDTPQCRM